MRALLPWLLCLHASCAAPAYFASVANQALRLKGGATLGPDLSVRAVTELEVQVGAPSSLVGHHPLSEPPRR